MSQNLISNGSFEIRSLCPDALNRLNYATGWINPTSASPDYFTKCATSTQVRVPSNLCGNQLAKSGDSYSGIITYTPSVTNFREYIQYDLLYALSANRRYFLSYNLSLADSSMYSIKQVCAALTNVQLVSNNYYTLQISPTICPLNNVSDDQNWSNINHIYNASGGEQYLTIGNFNNDSGTDTIIRAGNYSPSYYFAYYYIDDVSVIPIPEIEAGPSVQIIQGNNSQFNATIENGWNGLQYRWRPSIGLSDSTILNPIASPSQTTTYYLHLIDTSGTASFVDTIIDSLKVTVVPNGINEIRESVQKINIYPNPANTIISISGMSGMNEIAIYDPLGEVVLRSPLPGRGAEGEVNIEMLPAGIYFVRVRSENGEAVGRFVKQ